MTLCGLTDRMPPQSESIYLGRKWLEGWFVPGAFRDAWGQFQGKRNKILLGDAITGSEELFWPRGGGGRPPLGREGQIHSPASDES